MALWGKPLQFEYFFLSVANPPKLLHLIHCSEYPKTSYAIMEKTAPQQTGLAVGACLIADSNFDLILNNLKGFYAPRRGQKMEAKGHKYRTDK